ncbi:MAG: TolC family protein [Magnetococcales bacterium]|nr:TolC family protein [Magnetococcales bacterium]
MIYFVLLWSFLLCFFPTQLVAEDNRADTMGLIQFVELTLEKSDTALTIQENSINNDLDLDQAQHNFTTQWQPLSSFSTSNNSSTQSLGIEAKRSTTWGPKFTVGVAGDRIATENGNDTISAREYINVSQGLFRRWGSKYTRLPLTIAELKREQGRVRNEQQTQDLILSAVRAFFQVTLSSRLLNKSKLSLVRAQANQQTATARQNVGLESKVDVYRAELAALNAENKHKDQYRQHEKDLEQANEMLSQNGSEKLLLDERICNIRPFLPENWQQDFLASHPEWRILQIEKKISDLNYFKAKRGLLPDANLKLALTQREHNNETTSTTTDNTEWQVDLNISSTLGRFDEKTTLKRQETTRKRLQRDIASKLRRLNRNVRILHEDLEVEKRRYRISMEQLKQAKLALELAHLRYERGLSNNLDLLDAEQAFSQAELDIVRNQVKYNLVAVNLAHKLGILDLEWLRRSLFIPAQEVKPPSFQVHTKQPAEVETKSHPADKQVK